jgi:transcriptional regulator with XRE-family HTH domain
MTMTLETDREWLATLNRADVARIDIPGLGDDEAVATHLGAVAARPTWTMTYDWARGAPPHGVLLRVVAALAEARFDLEAPSMARNLGAYVHEIREARDWSRETLAQRSGLDPVAVTLLEQGLITEVECSDAFVSRLAVGLGVPLAQLRFVMAPTLEPTPTSKPVKLILADLWGLIRETLAPAPMSMWGATLGAGASPSTTEASVWAAGLRGKAITSPVPLPAFEVDVEGGAAPVTIVPELRPVEGREAGHASLHLRLASADLPQSGWQVAVRVGRPPISGVTDTDGCVAFPSVRITGLLDAIEESGDWPVAVTRQPAGR